MDRQMNPKGAYEAARAGFAKRAVVLIAALLLAILPGCTPESSSVKDSKDLANVNIRADFRVVSTNGENIEVVAQLRDADDLSVYLQLSGKEQLFAANGVLTKSQSGGLFDYVADLAANLVEMKERGRITWNLIFTNVLLEPEYFALFTDPDRSSPFYVTFQRDRDRPIHDIEIKLPPTFTITSPVFGASISRSVPLDLQWSDHGYPYKLTIDAAAGCGEGYEHQKTLAVVDDPGFFTLQPVDLFGASPPAAEVCVVALALNRELVGLAPAQFAAGGVIRGIERRTVSLISQP